jgi:uncharacterized protein with PQ loop repeat
MPTQTDTLIGIYIGQVFFVKMLTASTLAVLWVTRQLIPCPISSKEAKAFSITTLSITTFSITTFSITTLSITTLGVKKLSVKALSINDIEHNDNQ